MRIQGVKAYENAVNAENSRWSDKIGRFCEVPLAISHKPKFQLQSNDKFFCIGSCFARNIEEALIYRGIEVLSKNLICPKAEYPNRPNGVVNKFTTSSMLNEVSWSLGSPESGRASGVNSIMIGPHRVVQVDC